MIRLPDKMRKSEKIDRMNEVIDELDLRHCVNTGEDWGWELFFRMIKLTL